MRILLRIAEVFIRALLVLRFGAASARPCENGRSYCGECQPCKAKSLLRYWQK